VHASSGGVSSSQKDSREFLVGQISKFVQGDGEAEVLGIVRVDEIQIGFEGSVSHDEFIMVIRLLVLLHPKGESGLILCLREGERDS